MQNLWVIWGQCKWGKGQGLFYTNIINGGGGGGTLFRKHIYRANTFFVHVYALLLTLDTICADNIGKPMAGCKNQLIKKCLSKF